MVVYEALGSLVLQVFKWKMNRKMQQVREWSSCIGQELDWLMFRMFPLPNFYKHSKSGGLWLLFWGWAIKAKLHQSVSLHGDHGQESFVDVPCRRFWGCEQTTVGRERARQALSHSVPMNRKWGGFSVPPCSEMSPELGQLPGEAYWGTAPGSQDSLDGGQSRLSCCRCLLLEEKTNDSLRQ